MRFVAEHGRGDLGHELTIGSLLAATALERPAHIAVLLGQPCRLGGPCLGDAAVLDDSALFIGHALRGAAMMLASTIGPPMPREPIALRCARSEEHTSELQSLMRISYAVFCLK